MDSLKFRQHLDNSLELLLTLTREHCYNDISEVFKFLIQPSGPDVHDGMDDLEAKNLTLLNKQKDKLLDADKLVDLFCHSNKVPLWINTIIYESRPNLTVVHLLCSRRLRRDEDLYYKAVVYPPFNVLVPLPPDSLRQDINGKFNINWKKQLDDSQRRNSFFDNLKRFLTGDK